MPFEFVGLFLFEDLGNTFTPSVSLLRSVNFSFFSSLLTMEDLTKNWSELSLSDREHAGFVLPKIHKSGEYIIAVKFLTSHYLIMEAAICMF